MIKLELTAKPKKLTIKFQKEKTNLHKKNGETVWNVKWLKEAIALLSYNKCCYSEVRLGEKSCYLEIEHFVPKSIDPNKVMEWGNLFPACKKCNTTKGKHNTITQPIVNPFVDNPKDYFYIKNYRYYPKALNKEIAERTIDVVALNDRGHFVKSRFKIGNQILDTLEDLFSSKENALNEQKRRYLRKLSNLMQQGNRKEEYAALISTLILDDKNYQEIEIFLHANSLWNTELDTLKTELEFCSLPE